MTFLNQSGGGTQQAISYFWDFGDGQFSSATNPVHHYNADGNYTVRLEATNPCGTVSFYQDVQVVSLPNAAFTSSNSIGCTPLTISYFDNSFSTIDSWQWSFPGGVPNLSGAQNPIITYSTSGTYPVTLIVQNSVGSDTLTQSTYVQVSGAANASFTAIVNGLTASFTNGSLGTNLTYAWNFGDNTNSAAINPNHSYAMPGVYMVQLIASNSCSSDTFIQSVSIQSIPVAIFQSITQVQCIPAQVQFHDNSQGDISFRKWTFSGGNPSQSALADPVVSYVNAGVYSVSLIVGNAAGNDTTVHDFAVTVEDAPIANFDVIIASNLAHMNNGSVNGSTWQWDFGDNTFSNMKDPGHEYTINGSYTIVLVASNSCGSDTFTQLVQIAVPQAAHFSFQSIGNCAPITVKFSDQSIGNPTQREWTFEGGVPATSTEQNPTVVYQTAGFYNVTLISRNGNISDTLWQDSLIEVRGKPVSAFSSITTGLEVDFSNQTLLGTSYHWSFGDGTVSTEIDPTHVYAAVDTFEVVLVAVNECGSDSTKRTIFTGGIPPAGGFDGGFVAGCAPFEVHFAPINANNWDDISWLFPGGNPASSADANPIVIYDNAGDYAVQMSLSNAFGTTVVTVDSFITVGDEPNANFSAEIVGLEGTFSNLSLSGQSFFWDFGDGGTSTELEPSHLFSGNGNYTVTLIATNACGSDTIVQNLQVTAIHSLIDMGWKLYPNPANDKLWVSAPAMQSHSSRWVFINFLGQKISANPLVNNNGNLFEFDLAQVPTGYWFLQMQSSDSIYYGKILIEK